MTYIMLIVFIGWIIIGMNSVIKINVAVLERKATLKYVLKHFGIIILITIAALLVLLIAPKILPPYFHF